MLLAIDVHYKENYAKAVGAIFNWEDATPQHIIIEKITNVEEYIPGQFYKRELPCIMALVAKVDLVELEAIIIDGHIYIDHLKNYGLGAHLWEALHQKIPIIGIAKKAFHTNKETVITITRGTSKQALYISSIGVAAIDLVSKIKNMHGDFRIPTVLKYIDTLTKED
jgi:deoxyribonuclease V